MKASPTNLTLLGLAERGRAATERNDADRYAAEQARILETVTRVAEPPAVKARGMRIPDGVTCNEHHCPLTYCPATNTWSATDVMRGCGCVLEQHESGARVVVRREERG